MTEYSSAQVAKKLGITRAALSNYIKLGKVPAPRTVEIGRMKLQAWNDAEVDSLRQLLPKIANGRKTRYKKQTAHSSQQSRQARDRSAKAKTKTRSKKKT